MKKLLLMSLIMISFSSVMAQIDTIKKISDQKIPDQKAAEQTPNNTGINPTVPEQNIVDPAVIEQQLKEQREKEPRVSGQKPVEIKINGQNLNEKKYNELRSMDNKTSDQQRKYYYQRASDERSPYKEDDLPIIGNKPVMFTFVVSPQITWMSSGSRFVSSSSPHLGFDYGVEGDIFLASRRYSVLTGLTISSLGETLTYNVTNFSFSGVNLPTGTRVDYYLRYLEIPIAIKLRSKDFNQFRFFAQFGLNNWFNIKAKASTSDGTFDKDVVGEEVRFYNMGLNVGGGVEYELDNNNSITGGLIYTGSFNDATKNSSISDKTTINALRIRLGFIF